LNVEPKRSWSFAVFYALLVVGVLVSRVDNNGNLAVCLVAVIYLIWGLSKGKRCPVCGMREEKMEPARIVSIDSVDRDHMSPSDVDAAGTVQSSSDSRGVSDMSQDSMTEMDQHRPEQ